MKVYEALASAVEEEGVLALFGVMGDANMMLWSTLSERAKVRLYGARHEAAAVAMADGYFRATGSVGVATVTCGPGLTQIGTSLVAANRNRSPLVLITGEFSRRNKSRLQALNQQRFCEASETLYFDVRSSDDVATDVAEAFYAAKTRRIPVAINFSAELLEEEMLWEWDYSRSGLHLPPSLTYPGEAAVAALAAKLEAAERPIILAGLGARGAEVREAIERVADRTGALLATSLQAKGLFAGHPYDIGIAGAFASRPSEELFAESDFILGIGAEIGYYTSEGGLLFPHAEVARIDIRPAPTSIGVAPGSYVQGDALLTMKALDARLEEKGVQREGFRTAGVQELLNQPATPGSKPDDGIDPRLMMSELSQVLPSDVVITCGCGHFWGFVAMYLAISPRASIYFSYQFGAIGQTLPLGLGIRAAQPNRPHILIDGDGSFMMNIQELETAVRHGLSLVVIVWNDGGYGAEAHKLRAKGREPDVATWTSPDFVAVARAFGGDGTLVKTASDIKAAVKRGMAGGGLFVIDARVSPTTISDPYGKIHMGIENTAPRLQFRGSVE